jgi:tetratricopeptide (TPR) repeat protein
MGALKIEYESAGDVALLLSKYDAVADKWDFSQASPFWDAVKIAHQNGYCGKGQCIAIIDSAFNLDIPKLQTQTRALAQKAPTYEDSTHGTAVALLVGTVAPDARLDLYETSENGDPSTHLIKSAFEKVRKSDASVVNFSVGGPPEWHSLDCIFCREARLTASQGKFIVAAAGNAIGDIWCPAKDKAVLGVGFQREIRKTVPTPDGGAMEVAAYSVPSYAQADTEYSLKQPEGVLGSSFASPLVTGALALIGNNQDIFKLVKAIYISSQADYCQEQLGSTKLNSDEKKTYIDTAVKLYNRAFTTLPHIHKGGQEGPPCIECSFFVTGLYINAGLFALKMGHLDEADPLLRTAYWLAPWSADATANLAALQIEKGEKAFELGDISESLLLFEDAKKGYLKALEMRPKCESYLSGLKNVTNILSGLKQ